MQQNGSASNLPTCYYWRAFLKVPPSLLSMYLFQKTLAVFKKAEKIEKHSYRRRDVHVLTCSTILALFVFPMFSQHFSCVRVVCVCTELASEVAASIDAQVSNLQDSSACLCSVLSDALRVQYSAASVPASPMLPVCVELLKLLTEVPEDAEMRASYREYLDQVLDAIVFESDLCQTTGTTATSNNANKPKAEDDSPEEPGSNGEEGMLVFFFGEEADKRHN